MKIPEGWLREFCDPPIDTRALADRLTMGGLEVEAVEAVAAPFSDVVVAQVLQVGPHPNSDHLTVCRVDVGSSEPVQIVCGAPNVAAGQRVPCALPGAVLPGDRKIGTATLRGVASAGMLCSARELGLSDDHAGLLVLAPDAPIGRPVRQVLNLDEQCLEIKLTPNRGDCLSVLGVARELAALTDSALRDPVFAPVPATCDERLPVRIEAPDLCGRFSGRVLRGLNARAETPPWMRARLERSGLRSVSALVDISNYVMLEVGRPSHVFDLAALHGGLVVRWGRPGERLRLLTGREVELDPGIGVIADQQGVQSLAGVMGGHSTAVTLDTTDIYLEAAFWWPQSIQGRTRRLNLITDAAHRFERGVDYATTVEHIEAITRMVVQICGTARTRIGPVDDQIANLPTRERVRVRSDRCRKVLGMPVSDEQMAQAFTRLKFTFARADRGFVVEPPSYRFDLQIEEDLIEEVARVVGYEHIPAHPPLEAARMVAAPETVRGPHELRRRMADCGYQELINYSFVDPASESDFGLPGRPISVVNPIASQHAVMRTTLFGGLVSILRYNLNQQASRVRIFEVGRVFRRQPGEPEGPLQVAGVAQPTLLGALTFGDVDDEQWGVAPRKADFFDIKGDLERLISPLCARYVAATHPALHPGRCARIEIAGQVAGWIGQLHPRLARKYELTGDAMLFEVQIDRVQEVPLPRVMPVAEVPTVMRDIAMWVPEELPAARIFEEIERLSARDDRLAVLREVRLFDVFRPAPGHTADASKAAANVLLNKEKSLAFRVVLQDTRRSLSDSDADAACDAIVEH
ncbi:MAG TPA: phenylalanine--tRNA ligase subunit beta, partial [Burkholderiaceae bacterium]|nr:phenylalanine--tRNA ligase subunit beta [Burkholderiaceae bacterium]